MRHYLAFLYFLSLSSCGSQDIILGQKLNIDKTRERYILLPTGSFVASLDTMINSTQYTVGVKNREVVFVSTRDTNFHILHDVEIGSSLSELNIKSSEVEEIPGWGLYARIDDTWYAGFSIKDSVSDSMRIDWIFKYYF